MQLHLKADVSEVTAMLKYYQRDVIPLATARALNKTLTTVSSEAARQLKQDLGSGITLAFVKKNVKKIRANRNTFTAALLISGHRLPISKIDPSAKQTASGITYRMSGECHTIPHAFLAQMKRSGHLGVFTRKGDARLPIHEKYGVSLPHILQNEKIVSILIHVAKARFQTALAHEIHFLLSAPSA
jgi:hypothetical protein